MEDGAYRFIILNMWKYRKELVNSCYKLLKFLLVLFWTTVLQCTLITIIIIIIIIIIYSVIHEENIKHHRM